MGMRAQTRTRTGDAQRAHPPVAADRLGLGTIMYLSLVGLGSRDVARRRSGGGGAAIDVCQWAPAAAARRRSGARLLPTRD